MCAGGLKAMRNARHDVNDFIGLILAKTPRSPLISSRS
jgi:hypothetical protein